MRNDKHLAIRLRLQGKSYNQITRELSIPKSTLFSWLSKENWSIDIKNKLRVKANRISKKRLLSFIKGRQEKWLKIRENFRNEAIQEFPLLSRNPLFIAGIHIYWGEGDSKLSNGLLRISNIDHRMIRIFVLFLEKIVKVPKEKVRIGLILYPDLSEIKCKKFWSEITGVPFQQFHKTQFIKGFHPTKRIERGICMVYVSSIRYKEKVRKWIDLFAERYNNIK